MSQDFEERLEKLFGDYSNGYEEKSHRHKEFLKKNRRQKRIEKWGVLIVGIRVVGEILHATNVTNPCIKKIVKGRLPIANAMTSMKQHGHKKRLNKANYKYKWNRSLMLSLWNFLKLLMKRKPFRIKIEVPLSKM